MNSRLSFTVPLLILGVAAASLFAAGPAVIAPPARSTSGAPVAAEGGKSLLGLNLERNVDYSRSRTWIDCVKTARAFDTVAKPGDKAAPLGPDGWPTTDFNLLLMSETVPSMAGDYTVIFHGKVEAIAGKACVVGPLQYDAAADITRATVHYNAAANKIFMLAFTGTSGPRRLQVLRPGYSGEDAAKKVFSDEFLKMLQALKPGTIRGMDFLQTNHSTLSHWSERPTRGTPLYSEGNNKGAPYEDLIDLCNAVSADLWLTVPALADDDYRTHLADLVSAPLSPSLNVYLEYSNEVWNTRFKQHGHNMDAVARERSSGVNFHADPNIASYQRVARETARLGDLFREKIPAGGRVRPVLCGQGVKPLTLSAGLDYLASTGVTPSRKIWGIAIAPYTLLTPDMAPNDWHVTLLHSKHIQDAHALARRYQLHSCLYEMGVDAEGAKTKVNLAGQLDPKMYELTLAYLNGWTQEKETLLGPECYFNVCSWAHVSGNGTARIFGLTDDCANLTEPKFKAAAAFSASTMGRGN